MELVSARPSPDLRCAYCHGAAEGAVACSGCGTFLHPACRAEVGSCVTLGCRDAVVRTTAARADSTPSSVALLLIGAGLFALSAAIADAPLEPSPLESRVAAGCWVASIATLLLIVAIVVRRFWNRAFVRAVVVYVVLPAAVLALLLSPCMVSATMM
jgi:hypothetical protein